MSDTHETTSTAGAVSVSPNPVDALSLMNVEDALDEISGHLNQMLKLAEQSLSLAPEADRSKLQEELERRKAEIDRIAGLIPLAGRPADDGTSNVSGFTLDTF